MDVQCTMIDDCAMLYNAAIIDITQQYGQPTTHRSVHLRAVDNACCVFQWLLHFFLVHPVALDFLIYTYWPHATWSALSWKKHFAGVSIWSIICRRCKPCQVVLGEGGSSTYWKRGEPDNQRHLAFLSHLALGV